MFRGIFPLCSTVLFLSVLVTGMSGPLLAAPKVVATIPPVQSLAAMVMEGTGFPQLLLSGDETPHSYSLRPSQSRMLATADIVIRVGDGLEGFLKKPLRALAGRAKIISLDHVPGVTTYANRADGGAHGHDGHGQEDRGHDHKTGTDPHLWLHTGNALAVIREIARVLSAVDPENAPVYAGNAARASIRLRSLKMEIGRIVAPIRDRPYFVFHDAWQYFEKEFGLRGGGAIAVSPERKPGARRMAEIRARIRSTGARCVFAEPQFPPALVKTVIRGTPATLATLDPLGVGLTLGPGQYPALMRNLAKGMVSCLSRS
jgi:zinc transport system substrate-binding protein